MDAYEDVFRHTSTKIAPWDVIPADKKWFMRIAVAAIVWQRMHELDLRYPTVSAERRRELLRARRMLLGERG